MTRARSGFVLPLTLTFVVVVALVVGTVLGYVSYAARATQSALARDRCRFAAQSAIEQAKIDIQEGFASYIASNFATIKIAPNKAKAFNWFDSVGSDRRTIGSPNPAIVFGSATMPVSVNGCRVWVGIADGTEHETNGAVAVVPLVATAEYVCANGQVVRCTLEEWIVFGTGQSKVFDNAYFVNNYGWMSGNFTINGEFRANGDVSLKNGAVVNGFIYAARNDEVGANGTVTVSSSSIYNQSKYRSTAGSRARYDTGNLNELGAYDPATATGTITAPTYDAQERAVSGSRTADYKAIVNQTHTWNGETKTVDPVEMPFVSDLASYADYAREENGTLSYPSVTYTDGTGQSRTVPSGRISAERTLAEAGPSGDAALADAGSVLLVGTQANPIVIDGPVVVAGDVIIKGYVRGQGTIYAGRNVHVIGDIKYVNAPSWNHSLTADAAKSEQAVNETKDMLGLVAKGNIVVGDATSSSIAANVNSGSDIAYSCDEDDSSIGYPSKTFSSTTKSTSSSYWGGTTTRTSNTFAGDYSAVEQINALSSAYVAKAPGGYSASSGQFGKVRTKTVTLDTYTTVPTYDWRGRQTGTKRVYDTRTELYTAYDRHYYETICDNAIVSSLRGTVSQVDAVMYNNHGVFGSLGAGFQINGALVCRDEGLTANGGTFNWDMRLRRKKNSEVVSKMGLPKGAEEPYTCRWMEVPESANPLVTGTGETP